MHFCHSILMKKKISGRICSTSADPDFRVRFFVSLCRSRSLLISAAVIHVVPAGVLGLILTGIAAGILAAVPLRIHRIGSVAVSAVVHITVMISHCAYLLFGFNKFVTGLVCEFERRIYRCAAVGFFQFLNTCNSCFFRIFFSHQRADQTGMHTKRKARQGSYLAFLREYK